VKICERENKESDVRTRSINKTKLPPNEEILVLTRPSSGLPVIVAIPALSYPLFFKMVKPSRRKSLY
jgi:hypothetical protein